MCGRKTLTKDMLAIIEELAVEEWEDPDHYFPSYNVAPTQTSPILVYSDKRIVRLMRWGLVPHWAKEASIGSRLINARAETLLEKPSFRNLVPRQRCVVIADGYYEWKKEGSVKQPYYIRHPEGKLLPMAGLWDRWVSPEGESLLSYTIITTEPCPAVAAIHNRMPVILPPPALDCWIDTLRHPLREALRLLQPYPWELTVYPVSRQVNSPRNNSPACIRPIAGQGLT
jgi:putative SOS response-associated peptidase YedK